MVSQEERGLLARIGFFLCRAGLIPEAETIFNGLQISAPEKDGPQIGLALCHIIKGENNQAVEILDKCLQRGSTSTGPLYLYKLLALCMSGRTSEAQEVREQMIALELNNSIASADFILKELNNREPAS